MRRRWFGATGLQVPEIAVEGEDLELAEEGRIRIAGRELAALVLADATDLDALRDAHARGTPIVVRAGDTQSVRRALERPEVSCALVPPERRELRELDLRRLKYG